MCVSASTKSLARSNETNHPSRYPSRASWRQSPSDCKDDVSARLWRSQMPDSTCLRRSLCRWQLRLAVLLLVVSRSSPCSRSGDSHSAAPQPADSCKSAQHPQGRTERTRGRTCLWHTRHSNRPSSFLVGLGPAPAPLSTTGAPRCTSVSPFSPAARALQKRQSASSVRSSSSSSPASFVAKYAAEDSRGSAASP